MLKAYFKTKKPVFNFFFCTSSSFGLLLFVFLCNVEWSTIKYASFKSTLKNSLNYRQTKSCIHYKLQFNSYVANLLGRFNGFIHIFFSILFLSKQTLRFYDGIPNAQTVFFSSLIFFQSILHLKTICFVFYL